MKTSTLILALLIASAGPSLFAKAMNSHHAHDDGAAKAARRRSAPSPHQGTAAKSSRDKRTGGKIDLGGSEVPLPLRDNDRNLKSPKLQIVKPDRVLTRHIKISVPPKPLVRNALGQSTSPTTNAKTGGLRARAEPLRTTPSVSNLAGHQTSYRAGFLSMGKPITRPSGPVGVSSRSTINGTGMIRPTHAALIGGPAKSVGGINGSLVRPKPH